MTIKNKKSLINHLVVGSGSFAGEEGYFKKHYLYLVTSLAQNSLILQIKFEDIRNNFSYHLFTEMQMQMNIK